MICLIGSKAARYHNPKIWEKCNDTDLVSDFASFTNWYDQNKGEIRACFPIMGGKKFYIEFNGGEICEWDIVHSGSTNEIVVKSADNLVKSSEVGVPGIETDVYIPSMDWLYSLKSSHRYVGAHFEKTIRDYNIMKGLGCQIVDKEWQKAREKETYKGSYPKLNRDKESFFSGDGIEYKYDHDTIHKAVAKYGFGDRPAYSYYMKDGAEVMSCRHKFFSLSEEIRLRGGIEETYVLALERSQIPHRGKVRDFTSFKMALMKVCTTITSGWFRAYCYENYFQILGMYNSGYIGWFDQGVETGLVKPKIGF